MKTITATLLSILTFLSPVTGLVIIMIGFILLDTAAGIYVSVKLGGWKSFQSDKLFNLSVKSFFYCFSIILAYLIDMFIFGGKLQGVDFLLSKLMTVAWVFIEIKSLDEKSIKIGNKPFIVIIRNFIKYIKEFKKNINEIKE
jgi:hypothetical protein